MTKGSTLVRASVQLRTIRDYKRGYLKFVGWLEDEVLFGRRLWPRDETELDETFADWVGERLDNSHARGVLQDCRNARHFICFFDPSMKLKYANRALNGWNNLVPANTTTPMPEGLMLLMVEWFLVSDDLQMAVLVAMSFEYMMRTQSELLDADLADVLLPGGAKGWWRSKHGALQLRDTKTAAFDSVTLDANLATDLLVRLYAQRKRARRQNRGARRSDKLFTVSQDTFQRRFHECLRALGLPDDHPFRPYSLRHGGATDMHMRGVDIRKIVSRGRWRRQSTCERYVSTGRAILGTLKLPKALKRRSKKLMERPSRLLNLVR